MGIGDYSTPYQDQNIEKKLEFVKTPAPLPIPIPKVAEPPKQSPGDAFMSATQGMADTIKGFIPALAPKPEPPKPDPVKQFLDATKPMTDQIQSIIKQPEIASTQVANSGKSYTQFDDLFKKYAGDLSGDDEFIRIVGSGAKAESGLNPNN